MANTEFGVEQVTRYLELVDRRMYILMHSGIDWKPEYEQELEEINKEISVLRELIDSVHDSRQNSGQVSCQDNSNGMHSSASVEDGSQSFVDDDIPRPLENLQHLAGILDTSVAKRMDDATLINEIGRYERLCDMEIFVYSEFIDVADELLFVLKDEAVCRLRRIVLGDDCAE